MKKLLLVLFLGAASLFNSTPAKSSMAVVHRVISITIQDAILLASSEPADGPIQRIDLYDFYTQQLVRTKNCEGYACSMGLSHLPASTYVAYVICTNNVGKKTFTYGG